MALQLRPQAGDLARTGGKTIIHQTCALLKLPAELRVRIYEEVIVHRSILEIYSTGDPVEHIDEWRGSDQSWARFRPSEPSLTKTCREIRDEGLPIFYGRNIFRDTHYDPSCLRFLGFLSAEKRMMLGKLLISHVPCPIRGYVLKRRGCIIRSQKLLTAVEDVSKQRGLQLGKGVVHVPLSLRDDMSMEWTNDPNGQCQLGGCCGNELGTIQLAS